MFVQDRAEFLIANGFGELRKNIFEGDIIYQSKEFKDYLNNFYPGGYILFAKDFDNHTKSSMKEEIELIHIRTASVVHP